MEYSLPDVINLYSFHLRQASVALYLPCMSPKEQNVKESFNQYYEVLVQWIPLQSKKKIKSKK